MRRERRATLGLAPALPGIMLVVVIVWALAAVLMLTGTLVNAREIDDTIPQITNETTPIDKDLDNIKLALETVKISAKIRDAAEPLVGQADRILEEAQNIDRTATTILGTANSINERARAINGTARAINDTVGAINGTVSAINGNVVAINGTVDSIEGNVLAINGTADSIDTRVTSINMRVGTIFESVGPVGATDDSIRGSVRSILARFRRLDPETKSINTGVAAINRRASSGVVGVASLKTDFGPIAAGVGPGLPGGVPGHGTQGPGAIHGHANSIDCAPLINLGGPTEYCNR